MSEALRYSYFEQDELSASSGNPDRPRRINWHEEALVGDQGHDGVISIDVLGEAESLEQSYEIPLTYEYTYSGVGEIFHPGAIPWTLVTTISLIPNEVTEFLTAHDLHSVFLLATELVYTCFSSLEEIRHRCEMDPDTGEEWVVIEIYLNSSKDVTREDYRQFTKKFLRIVPYPESNFVRLSVNLK